MGFIKDMKQKIKREDKPVDFGKPKEEVKKETEEPKVLEDEKKQIEEQSELTEIKAEEQFETELYMGVEFKTKSKEAYKDFMDFLVYCMEEHGREVLNEVWMGANGNSKVPM